MQKGIIEGIQHELDKREHDRIKGKEEKVKQPKKKGCGFAKIIKEKFEETQIQQRLRPHKKKMEYLNKKKD